MAYLSDEQVREMSFKRIGEGVKISEKASIYHCESIEIGDGARIDDFCVVSGKVVLGSNVYIAPFCLLALRKMRVILEDFSTLAYHVQVFT